MPDSFVAFVDVLDNELDALVVDLHRFESGHNATEWDKAARYNQGYRNLARRQDFIGLTGQKCTRAIHDAIRARAHELQLEPFPRQSFLSHARKLADTWSDIFVVDHKDMRYDDYRRIACCSLSLADRNRLRTWAEAERPRQAQLRQRIAEEVNVRKGIYRPDFELKSTNFWKFHSHDPTNGYGAVHGLIYANLLYWFTQPGDTILDPMAGTGVLRRVIGQYRYFQKSYEADGSGPRHPLMSDLAPSSEFVHAADATKTLPFGDGVAQLAVVDPPYLRIADSKLYCGIGSTMPEWLANLEVILRNTLRCVASGGLLAVLTDDVLRKNEHQPIAYRVTNLLERLGCRPRATIYNHNPNFVYTMGPAQMLAAQKARLHVNGCKIIQVAST